MPREETYVSSPAERLIRVLVEEYGYDEVARCWARLAEGRPTPKPTNPTKRRRQLTDEQVHEQVRRKLLRAGASKR